MNKNIIFRIYSMAWREAGKNPQSGETHLLLEELRFMDANAYESINSDIAALIIGG